MRHTRHFNQPTAKSSTRNRSVQTPQKLSYKTVMVGSVALFIPAVLIAVTLAAGPTPVAYATYTQNGQNTAIQQQAQALRQTNVRRLILTNACPGCELAGVNLSARHLIGADLRQANLQGANLSNTNLEGADFTAANLTETDFTGAFLTNAIMREAQLTGANFTEAYLHYVDVSGAATQNINLTNAHILETPLSVGGAEPLEADLLPDLSKPIINESPR